MDEYHGCHRKNDNMMRRGEVSGDRYYDKGSTSNS